MAENGAGQPGDQALCESWAEEYGLTFPVLADPGWGESSKYEQNGGIPTFHLLGRDLTIRILDGYPSAGDIEAALAEPMPEVEWDAPPAWTTGRNTRPSTVRQPSRTRRPQTPSWVARRPRSGAAPPAWLRARAAERDSWLCSAGC